MSDMDVLEKLISDLRNEDWHVRYRAADQLKSYRDVRAVPHLIKRLEDKNVTVRFVSAMTLGVMRDARAVLPLVEMLRTNHHHDIQWSASWALTEIGPEASKPLIDILFLVDALTRDAVADVLGRLQDPDAIQPLKRAFIEFGLEDHPYTRRFAAADALERYGAVSTAVFIETLQHNTPEIRERAVDALGILGQPEAVPALIDCLADERIPFDDKQRTYRVCDAAANALVMIGTEDALTAVQAWREAQSS